MLRIDGRQIVSRRGLDAGRQADAMTAQELQQLRHLATLATSGLMANAPVSASFAPLVSLDMHLAEISRRDTALGKPTIECQCMPDFDGDDVRRVLLVDQRSDKLAKMACERTRRAAGECRAALICSFHDGIPAGGSARQGGLLCPARRPPNAREISSIDRNGT
jgi:hypothetical protein